MQLRRDERLKRRGALGSESSDGDDDDDDDDFGVVAGHTTQADMVALVRCAEGWWKGGGRVVEGGAW